MQSKVREQEEYYKELIDDYGIVTETGRLMHSAFSHWDKKVPGVGRGLIKLLALQKFDDQNAAKAGDASPLERIEAKLFQMTDRLRAMESEIKSIHTNLKRSDSAATEGSSVKSFTQMEVSARVLRKDTVQLEAMPSSAKGADEYEVQQQDEAAGVVSAAPVKVMMG